MSHLKLVLEDIVENDLGSGYQYAYEIVRYGEERSNIMNNYIVKKDTYGTAKLVRKFFTTIRKIIQIWSKGLAETLHGNLTSNEAEETFQTCLELSMDILKKHHLMTNVRNEINKRITNFALVLPQQLKRGELTVNSLGETKEEIQEDLISALQEDLPKAVAKLRINASEKRKRKMR